MGRFARMGVGRDYIVTSNRTDAVLASLTASALFATAIVE